MTIYYVDSNAVGTNAGTSWTNAAESLEYLVETIGSLSAAAEIWFASNHSKDYGATTIIATLPANCVLRSVNSSTDVYTPGAVETCASGNFDLTIATPANTTISIAGMEITGGDDFLVNGPAIGCRWDFVDCVFGTYLASAAPSWQANIDGMEMRFTNCAYTSAAAAAVIISGTGARVILDGVSLAAGATKVTSLFTPSGNGATYVEVYNTDLSSIIAASGQLFEVPVAADDAVYCKLRRCKFPTGFTIFSGTPPTGFNYIIDIAECGVDDAYHYFYYEEEGVGVAEEDTTQYVDDGSVTYDGTNEFSVQIDTGTLANTLRPFRYKLATLPAQDLTTAKTITVELSGPAGLTDTEVWLEFAIQDVTDQALGAKQSSQGSDPLAAGTALTAGSATWATTTATEYKIAHDLGAKSLISNSNVIVTVCVGKASVAALNVSMPTIAAT